MKKTLLKVFAVTMAMLMVLSMTTAVFATSASAGNTITVENALVGNTYTLYKAFDVSLAGATADDGVNYTIDTNGNTKAAALVAAIKADEAKTGYTDADKKTVAATGTVCPYVLKEGVSGVYYVTAKEDFPEAAGRGWLGNQTANLEKIKAEKATAETVVFNTPGLGFYVITSADSTGKVYEKVTITDNITNVTVIDKNERKPPDIHKTTSKYSAEIGEEVPFTVSFLATNVNVKEVDGKAVSKRIMQYVVTETSNVFGLDTLGGTAKTDIFGDKNGTIKIYTTKDEKTGAFSGELSFGTGTGKYPTIDYTYDSTKNQITIVWGDSKTEGEGATQTTTTSSRYPDNVWVVLTYSMKVNDDVYATTAIKDAKNEVRGDFKVENSDEPEKFGEEDVVVHGASVNINKIGEDEKKLTGAKFILFKTVNEEVEGVKKDVTYYWVKSADNKVSWVTDINQATQVEADNNDDTLEFWGLAEGVYELKEVVAPAGYKLPDTTFTVTIKKVEPAKEGETSKPETQLFDVDVEAKPASYEGNGVYSTSISNTKGSNLPTTGGIGTTIFYIAGAILFVGAGVLLITRKRVNKAN